MLRVVVGTARAPEAQELRWEDIGDEELLGLAATPALFGGASRYLLRGALAGARGDAFLALAASLAASPHEFVLEEEKLLKAPHTKLEKAGARIEQQKAREVAPAAKRGFDPFGLTAALAARDRKRLWLALAAARRAGESPEASAGLLAWKARSMRDAALSRAVVSLYHDAHRGAGDLDLLLERFALTL